MLGVAPAELASLDMLQDDDLRVLHDRIGEAIFRPYRRRFGRVAGLAGVIPGPLAARLAERFLPPRLAARCAELLDPAQARELVSRFSVGYLADVAVTLDPTRSAQVVQAIPAGCVGQVARELFARGEYAAMAEFAGAVTAQALTAALDVASGTDLLEVVPLLVWNPRIEDAINDLSGTRLDRLVAQVVHTGRWDDAALLLARLRPDTAADIVRRVAPDNLARLATGIDVSDLGPIIRAVPVDHVRLVARALLDQRDYPALARFADVVTSDAMRAALDVATTEELLHVVPLLSWNDTIEQVVDRLPAARIVAVLQEVADTANWAAAEAVLARLTDAQLDRLATRREALSPELTATLHAAADNDELGPHAYRLFTRVVN